VSQARYSPSRQALHWLTVVLMFAILPVAWIVGSLKEDTQRFYFWLDVHKALGLSILLLTVVRIAWRIRDPAPRHPAGMPLWALRLAQAVTVGLLALMIVMPVTGYLWTTGHGYDIFDSAPFNAVHMPRIGWKDKGLGDLAKSVHLVGRWLVFGLIGLHLAGVSYHLIVRRDGLLGRMLPEQSLEPGV
jgi:cytochrome b561